MSISKVLSYTIYALVGQFYHWLSSEFSLDFNLCYPKKKKSLKVKMLYKCKVVETSIHLWCSSWCLSWRQVIGKIYHSAHYTGSSLKNQLEIIHQLARFTDVNSQLTISEWLVNKLLLLVWNKFHAAEITGYFDHNDASMHETSAHGSWYAIKQQLKQQQQQQY